MRDLKCDVCGLPHRTIWLQDDLALICDTCLASSMGVSPSRGIQPNREGGQAQSPECAENAPSGGWVSVSGLGVRGGAPFSP